jgi:hypothetical protein
MEGFEIYAPKPGRNCFFRYWFASGKGVVAAPAGWRHNTAGDDTSAEATEVVFRNERRESGDELI